eukprot:TRINITY_DN14302_c0_g1_i1.p1 TRINITY_DN14302_c0_g1~~TRINITY_DN14302_c0_g1_i1.p1  ORF type:complete len:405 (-),score=86.94 TRINITY_DN14302_c0_g1_i1:70-1284(-)
MGARSHARRDRYLKLEKIGEGSCGVVFKCRDTVTDATVAVKKVCFSYERGPGGFGVPPSALREVAALRMLVGHPNVVGFREAFLEPGGRLFVVCDYLKRDLRRYMDEAGAMHPRRAQRFAWQLLRAVGHCHACGLAHRDVKPQNILVTADATTIKLCDFSLARTRVLSSEGGSRRVASLWYRSPELLLGGESCGLPLDVWSVGCVIGEMLRDTPIFPGHSEIETLLMQFQMLGTPTTTTWHAAASLPHWCPEFPRFPPPPPARPRFAGGLAAALRASPEAAGLLEKLLKCNPDARPAAERALSHGFFADADKTGLPVPSPLLSDTDAAGGSLRECAVRDKNPRRRQRRDEADGERAADGADASPLAQSEGEAEAPEWPLPALEDDTRHTRVRPRASSSKRRRRR